MILMEATDYGYRLEFDDPVFCVRGYDINVDYLDDIQDEETREGIYALLTEIEILCANAGMTPSDHAARQEKEWQDDRDEQIARANQGRL